MTVSSATWKRPSLWIALLAILVVAAAVVVYHRQADEPGMPAPASSDVMCWPAPSSMVELVSGYQGQKHDVVVVARVDAIVEQGYEPTVGPIAGWPTSEPWPGNPPESYTTYRLLPERILWGDGTIGSGAPLLITRAGHPEDGPEYCDEERTYGYPFEQPGERYLYFLTYMPEYEAYQPTLDQYSRLIIDGDEVMYSSTPPQPVPFASGMSPGEFVDAVAAGIASSYPTPGP